MSATAANDTMSYTGSDGQRRDAQGVYIIGGMSASLSAPWDGASIAAADYEECQISFKNISGGDSWAVQGSTVRYRTGRR
jgi:hypothetical protein